MITRLPDDTHFDAMAINATIGHPVERDVFGVVMRAGYILQSTVSGVRLPVLTDDVSLKSLTVAGDEAPGTPEPDLAAEKERIDIIVLGHVDPGAGVNSGRVDIEGIQRRLRENPQSDVDTGTEVPTDLDQHLFGLHGMGEDDRIPDSSIVNDVATYHPRVNNAYRRSPDFTAPSTTATLPPGAEVTVFQNSTASGTGYRFNLPADEFTAQLRLATGHCPDRPNRWAIFGKQDLVPDTLVVSPDENTAHMVWRCTWAADSFDPAQLRAIQIDRKET